jgi:uroporphyrinogen-III decarboxylase
MPGRELPENSVWQVDEKTHLNLNDYDFILNNGMDAMLGKLMPELFSQEDFQLFMENIQKTLQVIQTYIDAGYPVMDSGTTVPPFETLCGGRGMNNFFLDCYKIPDKVKAVQDVMMESIRKWVEQIPEEKYALGAWVGGWRGASSIVNQKIWDKLVWPYMKELAELVASKGKIPIMHLDASWDRDIERFKELPAKTIILNTDGMTDLRRARKLLGDHAAFLGDVPVQMLAVSSKEEVADYTKRLIDDVGPQGLLLCPGCDAPATAKFENMAAIYETAQKYQ